MISELRRGRLPRKGSPVVGGPHAPRRTCASPRTRNVYQKPPIWGGRVPVCTSFSASVASGPNVRPSVSLTVIRDSKPGVSHLTEVYETGGLLRFLRQRTKPLRGGEDRALFTGRRRQQLAPSCATSLVACTDCASPCYAPVWLRSAAASAPLITSRSSGTLPRPRPLPSYSIYLKAKAVPIAASSSELASARPTGPH